MPPPLQFKSQSIHIKLVAGFYYLAAVIIGIIALAYIFASPWVKSLFATVPAAQEMSTSTYVMWGLALLLIAGLEAFFAFNIGNLSKIARAIAIVISAIGAAWAIFGWFNYQGYENIMFLVLHTYFLWALVTKWK